MTVAIVGIHHVQLAMPAGREEEARRFYSVLLGIPETPKPPDLAKRLQVYCVTHDVTISGLVSQLVEQFLHQQTG